MTEVLKLLLPEIILAGAALVLMLMGVSRAVSTRKVAPVLALVALAAAFIVAMMQTAGLAESGTLADPYNVVRGYEFGQYIKLLTVAVGALLVLLAWPSNADGTGNASLNFSTEGSEFFSLLLLSLCGVLLTASANDMILLFLALELVSLPTYVMVSISRPTAVAQEAGIKYFFLGAMSAAVMLFGFSYIYGVTGTTDLHAILQGFVPNAAGEIPAMSPWMLFGVVVLLLGLAFKIAAFPMHFYAGDVYQGAATPVTAFLAFTPKTAGFVAIIKVLFVIGGGVWLTSQTLVNLLMVLAVLTMTVGNVLGLLQYNVKRVLAYSSVAHSGYMLVGLTALMAAGWADGVSDVSKVQADALRGVLFYLTAYGLMNAGAFGVLMLLPSREPPQSGDIAHGTTAETFEDLAGTGRRHVGLGLAMAVCCFSLTGLPLTIGFFGKALLILPALDAKLLGLVIIMVVNAAISAGYYLRIIGTMFLRTDPAADSAGQPEIAPVAMPRRLLPVPIVAAVVLSVIATLLLGVVPPVIQALSTRTSQAVQLESAAAARDLSPQAATLFE